MLMVVLAIGAVFMLFVAFPFIFIAVRNVWRTPMYRRRGIHIVFIGLCAGVAISGLYILVFFL